MTTFLERLRNDPLNRATQEPLCNPTRAATTVSALPQPPPGYRRPHSWDQLWIHRDEPGRILLSTPSGWEGIDGLELVETVKSVQDLNDLGHPTWDSERGGWRMKKIPWEKVVPGVVYFHGTRMEGLKLTSIRIPGAGGRERRHG